MKRSEQRMLWLLRRLADFRHRGFVTAWDVEDVDAFVAAFPEAERTLRIYTLGPHSSPMLNAAAARAKRLGYLVPGSVGTMDARSFNQRTWARTWKLTDAGRAYLKTKESTP